MSSRYDHQQEPGEAWMRGDIPGDQYFDLARQQAVQRRRPYGLWQRILQWIKPGRGRR